ncbi:MAG: DUF86 domain-containing protein [Acidobacteria bacterium]|nr:DUF86 domain-containing protein [Acidobacteriota bacterium]
MSKRGNLESIADIREAIKRIESYTRNLTYQAFLKDTKTQDAVVRNLEIIGEAVKNLSTDFRRRHQGVDWKQIAGFRDRLIHGYFGVNWDILWNVITEKVPELEVQIEALQREMD